MMMKVTMYAAMSLLLLLVAATEQLPLGVEAESRVDVPAVTNFGSDAAKNLSSDTTDNNYANVSCTPWFVPDSTGGCKCGDDLHSIVECDSTSHHIHLLTCYCMTEDKELTTTIVGACVYNCFASSSRWDFHSTLKTNSSGIDEIMCGSLHRTGQLCGQCMSHFAPPVFSYHLECVNCTTYSKNWVKYVAISFLPLTLFFVILVVFRFSATSPTMNAFILVSQTLTATAQLRAIAPYVRGADNSQKLAIVTLNSLYAVWNLDFFRLLVDPFCIHPKMTTLQALALDYIVALYPLFLVIVTYLLVEMHDHFRVIVWLWKPFHRVLARFRRHWHIRNSLVDALATFLFLSCVKLLSVSLDLLTPTTLYDATGKRWPQLYLYYDGTVEYFGPDHVLYGILAISVLLLFIILPILLLCLYPCRCCRRRLSDWGMDYLSLQIFMDVFHGCYKDGTNGTRDCRQFAAVYLIIRVTLSICFAFTLTELFYIFATAILICVAMSVSIIQPYKSQVHNAVDTFLIVTLALIYLFAIGTDIATLKNPDEFRFIPGAFIMVLFLVPLAYGIGVLLHWLFFQQKLVQRAMRTAQAVWTQTITTVSNTEDRGSTGSEENRALLRDPVA